HGRRLQRLQALFKNAGEKIHEKLCSGSIWIFRGIVGGDLESGEMPLLHENQQRLANFIEAQAPRAGIVGGLEIGNYVYVEMEDKLVGAAVNSVNCRL